MKKSMTLLLAVLLALLCACGGNNADGLALIDPITPAGTLPGEQPEPSEDIIPIPSAEPTLEGVWVCEGSYARSTLTLDADGHGTWENTYYIEGWENSTVEVNLQLYNDLAELGDKWLGGGVYDWMLLDTTGDYLLFARWPFVREGGPTRQVEPDPALTGTWEMQIDDGLLTYVFSADGVYTGTLGDQSAQATYIVFPGGDGSHNMILPIFENDYMGADEVLYYEIVEIDGVEHFLMAPNRQNFTDPDFDMTRAG